MFKLGDRIIPPGNPFVHNEIQYPANWLNLSTAQEKAAIGITEEPDPVRGDERFFYNNSDGSAPTQKPLDQITPSIIARIKAQASELILSHFPITKQLNMLMRVGELNNKLATGGTFTAGEAAEAAAMQSAGDWIKAVRAHSNALEAEVLAANFATLVEWQSHDWPTYG